VGTWVGLALPGLFAPTMTPTVVVTPTLAVTPTTARQETVIFADDFSDTLSGWPTIQDAAGGYGYQSDGYHIFINRPQRTFWAKTNRQDGNATFHVEAKPVTTNADGYYGLLCRLQANQDFYYFVVRSNGDFTIGKYKDAEFQSFLPNGWQYSSVINQDNQTNRLKADCLGNTLRFYVNDTLLGQAVDSDFKSGFSGLLTATLDVSYFEVTFNHFLITKTDQ
jgi:hypothetical protein